MKKFRNIAAGIVLSVSLLAQQGCIGSFQLVTGLCDWNKGVGDKWVQELVFLGLNIIPVYGLAAVGDAFIFNLVEFWTGSNPLAMKEGEYEEQIITMNGKKYKMVAEKNTLAVITLTGKEKGRKETLQFNEENMAWNLTDARGSREVCRLEENIASRRPEYVLPSANGSAIRLAAPADETAMVNFRNMLRQADVAVRH